jgi:hypothetical protein
MDGSAQASAPDRAAQDERRADAAAESAGRWLRAARQEVDAAFGEGHAARHPELVAALVQASAIEAGVQAGLGAHQEALQALHRVSRETNATLLKLKPKLFG